MPKPGQRTLTPPARRKRETPKVRRERLQQAAQDAWQREQRARRGEEAITAQRQTEDALVAQAFNDILNSPISDRALLAAHEITPDRLVVSLVIPIASLRKVIAIIRARLPTMGERT